MMIRIFGIEENFGGEENMLQSQHSSLFTCWTIAHPLSAII